MRFFLTGKSANEVFSDWQFSQSSNFSLEISESGNFTMGIQPIRYLHAGKSANEVFSHSGSHPIRFLWVESSINGMYVSGAPEGRRRTTS
jgi:hypothetical protein